MSINISLPLHRWPWAAVVLMYFKFGSKIVSAFLSRCWRGLVFERNDRLNSWDQLTDLRTGTDQLEFDWFISKILQRQERFDWLIETLENNHGYRLTVWLKEKNDVDLLPFFCTRPYILYGESIRFSLCARARACVCVCVCLSVCPVIPVR